MSKDLADMLVAKAINQNQHNLVAGLQPDDLELTLTLSMKHFKDIIKALTPNLKKCTKCDHKDSPYYEYPCDRCCMGETNAEEDRSRFSYEKGGIIVDTVIEGNGWKMEVTSMWAILTNCSNGYQEEYKFHLGSPDPSDVRIFCTNKRNYDYEFVQLALNEMFGKDTSTTNIPKVTDEQKLQILFNRLDQQLNESPEYKAWRTVILRKILPMTDFNNVIDTLKLMQKNSPKKGWFADLLGGF